MAGAPDPKPERRVRDRDALSRARTSSDECAGCGYPPANVHHIVQKGSPHFGDDCDENLLLLCGTGTARCHGALHGSPYVVKVSCPECNTRGYRIRLCPACKGAGKVDERRDAEWVARRVGKHILRRQDTLLYVVRKLRGVEPALAFLERSYYIDSEEARKCMGLSQTTPQSRT